MGKRQTARRTRRPQKPLDAGSAKGCAIEGKLPDLDIPDIAQRMFKMLSPEHQEAFRGLPRDLCFQLLWWTANATRDFIFGRATLTFDEQELILAKEHAERSARNRKNAEDLAHDVVEQLANVSPLDSAQLRSWAEAHCQDLVDDILYGHGVELDALFDAASVGRLAAFLKQRELQKYKDARRAIRAIRSDENTQLRDLEECAIKLSKSKPGPRKSKKLAELQKRAADFFATAPSEATTARKYTSEFFGFTFAKAVRKYWLPLGLWKLSTKEALTALANSPAASLVKMIRDGTLSPSQRAELERKGVDVIEVKNRSSLHDAGLERAYRVAVSRIRKMTRPSTGETVTNSSPREVKKLG